jgi:hypothetical protein
MELRVLDYGLVIQGEPARLIICGANDSTSQLCKARQILQQLLGLPREHVNLERFAIGTIFYAQISKIMVAQKETLRMFGEIPVGGRSVKWITSTEQF